MNGTPNIRIGIFAVLVTALSVIGCQSNPAVTSVRYDNVRFMDVWSTYTHCLSSDQTQTALFDSHKLRVPGIVYPRSAR